MFESSAYIFGGIVYFFGVELYDHFMNFQD